MKQQNRTTPQGALARRANMATFNQREFHPEIMEPGSTGVYQDMKGGAHFEEYDCGHTYNDAVVRESFLPKEKKNDKAQELMTFLRDQEEVRKAVIAGEILATRGGMRHRRKR